MANELDIFDDIAAAEIVNEFPLARKLHIADRITEAGAWAAGDYVETILNADTLESATGVFDNNTAEDYENIRLVFEGASFLPSTKKDSRLGVYAIIRAVVPDTGELVTFTCGGETVVATLIRAREQGDWFPFEATLTKGAKTAAGFQPWNLVLPQPTF